MVKWALSHVRHASIERHAQDTPPLSLDDTLRFVQAGARAFSERGCVNCHGGPGIDGPNSPKACTPGPPDLKELANETSPQELFWVIKNGINMTGMPGFGAIDVPDQEIWTSLHSSRSCRPCRTKISRPGPGGPMPHVKVTAECPKHSPSAISLASCTSCELSASTAANTSVTIASATFRIMMSHGTQRMYPTTSVSLAEASSATGKVSRAY